MEGLLGFLLKKPRDKKERNEKDKECESVVKVKPRTLTLQGNEERGRSVMAVLKC